MDEKIPAIFRRLVRETNHVLQCFEVITKMSKYPELYPEHVFIVMGFVFPKSVEQLYKGLSDVFAPGKAIRGPIGQIIIDESSVGILKNYILDIQKIKIALDALLLSLEQVDPNRQPLVVESLILTRQKLYEATLKLYNRLVDANIFEEVLGTNKTILLTEEELEYYNNLNSGSIYRRASSESVGYLTAIWACNGRTMPEWLETKIFEIITEQ